MLNELTLAEKLAAEIRRKLYASEYGCLSAYLHDIQNRFAAEEVGVFSELDDKLIRRRSSSKGVLLFDGLRDEITETINRRSTDSHTIINDLSRWFFWEQNKVQVILRRIWPDRAWRESPRETFWMYVVGPRIIPQTRDSPDPERIQQFGSLMSAFIRWKNEVFSQRDDLLSARTDEPEKVLQTHHELVVRPMQPHRFYGILNRFDPTPRGNGLDNPEKLHEWCCFLDAFFDVCRKPKTCECLFTCGLDAGAASLTCPQTEWIDRRLEILKDLEKWRTGVWRTRHQAKCSSYHGKPTRPRIEIVLESLRGLAAAADAMLWTGTEDSLAEIVKFSEGHATRSNERFLVKYFCARAIQMSLEKFGKRWHEDGTRSAELELPARMAALASLLLGNGAWTPEAIENLIRVVALFGHEVLEIPERMDLVRHLNQTLRGETALHTLKRRYRDHFFHTLEVCFLGFLILTSHPAKSAKGTGKSKTFVDDMIEKCRKHRTAVVKDPNSELRYPNGLPPLPETTDEFLAQWWTASLIHDTAYGIDIFGGTLRLLDFFTNHNGVSEFTRDAGKTVSALSEKLRDIAPELKDDKSIQKSGDHGVIAAASLSDVLKHIGPRTAARFQPAVRAIAFHNTRHPKVDAGVDPVAALLILCDTVQEWGRSTIGFTKSPAVLLSRMMEAASVPEEEQFGPVQRYGINIQADTKGIKTGEMPSTFAWAKSRKLKIELDYGQQSLSSCGAKFTWADMTYNFQRVDFRPWKIEIEVQVSVPIVPRDSRGLGTSIKTQIEYFNEFVNDQQVLFLDRWLRTAFENDPEKAIRSWIGIRDIENNTWAERNLDDVRKEFESLRAGVPAVPVAFDTPLIERELISFNLPVLSEMFCEEVPLMGGHAGDFDRAIKSWSVYAREQADEPPVQRPPV